MSNSLADSSPWKPAVHWAEWDDCAAASLNVYAFRQKRGPSPVEPEVFAECWQYEYQQYDGGVVAKRIADRRWRHQLPRHHPHWYDFWLTGATKFEGVNMGPVDGETWPTESPKLKEPKPLRKTPMTEDEKFNYRIRLLFEEERKRYTS
jgi:hypothetical protein